MRIIDAPANPSGTTILAAYDIVIDGITLKGCVMTESATGTVTARGLLGKTNNGSKISAQFTDAELALEVSRKAADAYSALTGRTVSIE
ncbi:hypothetical protein [Roseovarius pacificus]|uniref:hypothetical protein n=1 Tax=Roseovarius pacificus TaxID=337701 RepID=UPI002A187367|nr:hypothetical protein [Roseovarius pacificus]